MLHVIVLLLGTGSTGLYWQDTLSPEHMWQQQLHASLLLLYGSAALIHHRLGLLIDYTYGAKGMPLYRRARGARGAMALATNG